MDTLLAILTIVVTPLLSVVGIVITQKHLDKRDKMKYDAEKDSSIDAKLKEMSDKHEENLKEISKEYREEFKKVNARLDNLSDAIKEVKTDNQTTVTLIQNEISTLSNRVEKHNNVIDRTYALELAVAVLDNREKVSENRLSDLERHEEKKN